MNLDVATEEQILAFSKGAEDRFAELEVEEKVASDVFGAYMDKAASDMGFMSFEKAARVDAIASVLAEQLGLERPQA